MTCNHRGRWDASRRPNRKGGYRQFGIDRSDTVQLAGIWSDDGAIYLTDAAPLGCAGGILVAVRKTAKPISCQRMAPAKPFPAA
jgi:hypothetical protein